MLNSERNVWTLVSRTRVAEKRGGKLCRRKVNKNFDSSSIFPREQKENCFVPQKAFQLLLLTTSTPGSVWKSRKVEEKSRRKFKYCESRGVLLIFLSKLKLFSPVQKNENFSKLEFMSRTCSWIRNLRWVVRGACGSFVVNCRALRYQDLLFKWQQLSNSRDSSQRSLECQNTRWNLKP